MTQHLRDRIARRLEPLSEERLYQVLDYVEFLESKYAERQNPAPNLFQSFAETVEDKMRAGRVSATTIADTMGLLNKAAGMLNNVATVGKTMATDLATAAQRVGTVVADATTQPGSAPSAGGVPPADPTAPPSAPPGSSTGPTTGPSGAPTPGDRTP